MSLAEFLWKDTDMKSLVNILSVLMVTGLLCISCGKSKEEAVPAEESETDSTNNQQEQAMLIQPMVGVGKVHLAMTIDEVKQILGEPEQDEANPDAFVYKDMGLSVVCPDKKTVRFIIITGGNYQTAEGIGIGSTRKDVLATYGEPDKKAKGNRQYYQKMQIIFTITGERVVAIMLFEPVLR